MPSEVGVMRIEGAVSPSGWALHGNYIRKAAGESVSRWAQAQEEGSTEDRVSIRAEGINWVRERAGLLPVPRPPLPSNFRDSSPYDCRIIMDAEVFEEIPLVQNLIENWRSMYEPGFLKTLLRADRSSASDEGHPSAKRARLDGPQSTETAAQGEVVVHQHASAGPSALAESGGGGDVDQQPAAKAFFNLPELLSILCTYLTYEKADLIVLSQVSKRLRAVVLPTLYSSVRVRMTKIDQLSQTLNANPGLIEHIRYLSIWDDAAHYHSICNPESATHLSACRTQVVPEITTAAWTSLGDFLLAIQNRRYPSKPRVELWFGQMNLVELYDELRRAPRVLETLTALTITDDFGAAHFKNLDRKAVESTYFDHGTTISEDLTALLRLVCDVQDDANLDNFQTFEFYALKLDTQERRSLLPMLPPRLLRRLAGRMRNLCFSMSVGTRLEAESFKVLTEAHWSKLRRFEVYTGGHSAGGYAIIQSAMTSFLRRHMHLVEIDVRIDECSAQERRPHWVSVSLPRLVACHLEPTYVSTELQLSFANAHQDIRKLWVTGPDGAKGLANHRAIIKSLRFLRAVPDLAADFFRAGTTIRYLHLDGVARRVGDYGFPLCLTQGARPGSRPTPSLTGLGLHFVWPTFTQIMKDAEIYLPLQSLPNLVELSLRWQFGAVREVRDSPEQSVQYLAALLNELAKHGAKLRALRVDYEAAADLPCDSDLAQVAIIFPPKLEYLVWHVPFSYRTDYYRVLRPQATPPPSSTQVAQSSQSRLGQSTSSTLASETQPKVRLQRLPAIFRPKVDPKSGMWEDLDDEDCLSLFDHMGREPRLKFM